MIRQWFILSVMALVMAASLWNFVTEALLYSPLQQIQETEKAPAEKPISKSDYKAAWGTSILKDNLFSPNRRPPAPRPKPAEIVAPSAPPAPPPPKPVKPILKLNGIIVNQYGEFIAYIVKGSANPVAAREGDELGDNVKVISIDARSVKLSWLGEEIELNLSQIETLTR